MDFAQRTSSSPREAPAVSLTDPSTSRGEARIARGCEEIPLELTVFERPLRKVFVISREQIHLTDLVAPARALTDEIVSLTIDHVLDEGKRVSCRKHCDACCRYLVPVCLPEALQVSEEISRLTGDRRRKVLRSFESAARTIARTDPPELPECGEGDDEEACNATAAAGLWYARLDLPCPYLRSGLCRFYEARPLACREHFATCPPSQCSRDDQIDDQKIAPPVSVLEALADLTSQVEGLDAKSVMFPLAPIWAHENRHLANKTWDGRELLESLVSLLERQAGRVPAMISNDTAPSIAA